MAKYQNPIIYERIEDLVKRNGMVMFDISKKLGISTGNISDWKSGKSVPGCEKLIMIADFFNVPVDYILARDKFVLDANDKEVKELYEIFKDLDREGRIGVMSEAYSQRRRLNDERKRKEKEA